MDRRLAAFVRLSRLKFLAGGVVAGAFGSAMGAYERHAFDLRAYAIAQATITSAHLMTHYANEYFDRDCDRHALRTPFSGGSGVLVAGELGPRVALVAAIVCLFASLVGDVALVLTDHGLAAGFGVGLLCGAWCYSAPPIRLLARGLGELDTALVVAILVPLCAYVAQAGRIDLRAIVSTLPAAAAMFVMMLCVEVPDARVDAATGKRNLLVRFGPKAAVSMMAVAITAVVAFVGLALIAGAPPTFAIVQSATIVPGLLLIQPLRAFERGETVRAETVAARGVAFFSTVVGASLLGYAWAAIA